MFKTMPDDLFSERLMSRLDALQTILNPNIQRDFDVWVILKDEKDVITQSLSLKLFTPVEMHNIILRHCYDGADALSVVFTKYAGTFTYTTEAQFDILQLCNCYDYRELIKSQVKFSVEKCIRKAYGF